MELFTKARGDKIKDFIQRNELPYNGDTLSDMFITFAHNFVDGRGIIELERKWLDSMGATGETTHEKWCTFLTSYGYTGDEDGMRNFLNSGYAGVSFVNLGSWLKASQGVLTNTAAHFASANKEYATIPSNASLQTGDIDFEVGGWVRFDSLDAVQTIVGKGNVAGSSGYSLFYSKSSNLFAFSVGNGSGNVTCVSTGTTPQINTWYFVQAWRDVTTQKIYLRVNNGTINSSSGTNVPDIEIAAFKFGKDLSTNYLNGRLDSWYFQKRISTTAEATSLYNAGAGRIYSDLNSANGLDTFKTGLTSWWDFNEEGGTFYDSVGDNDLTATADAIIAPPVYGSELIVNGGFESDFTGWTISNGDGATAITTTAGELHGGSKAAKITGGATPAGTPLVYRTFSVTAGASYYYSFWSRGDGSNAGRFNIFDATNSVEIVSVASTNNPTTTYKLFTGQFTAPAGCTTAFISCRTPNAVGGITYFDDVSVKQITTASINNGGFDLRPATGGEKTNVSTVSRARTSNVATMVATAHGLKDNDVVTITGMTDTTFNGTNKTVTVVDVDTFTYASTGSDAGSAGDTGGRVATDVFSSWAEGVVGATTTNAETTAPYSGSYAARLDIDASNSEAKLTQTILIAGKKYTSSVYAKANSVTPNIRMGDSATAQYTGVLTTSYALHTATFTANNNIFWICTSSGATRSIFIDQVTLTSLGPTAEAGIAAGNAIDGNFAAGFNGTSQYLSVASNASLQTGDIDFEVGGSFYLDNKSSNKNFVSKYDTTGNKREWLVGYNAANDRLVVVVTPDGSTQTALLADALGSPSIGKYYFIRAWHNATANTLNIQVNNGTINSVAYTTGIYVSDATFNIGYSTGYGYHAGRADGVYLRKAISTTQEATALYNNGKGLKYASLPDSIKNDTALKGYWDLDEKSGTRYDSTSNANDLTSTVTQVQGVNYYEGTVGTVFDASGSNNTFSQATLSKRPTYCSICLNGKPAMLFDGVDDYVEKGSNLLGVGDITITAVINAMGWGGGTNGRIIENGAGGTMMFVASTGAVRLSSNGGTTAATSGNGSVALATSYIVTMTRTSSGVVNIYLNGTLAGSADQDSGVPTAGAATTQIGNRAAGDRAFDGSIAECLVYSKILTTAQRSALEKNLSTKYQIALA